ncbi:hypothetical protein [Micromonospora tarensis]|uniref:Uncharacterized protein n=1 Tax=Micromonospora tarensis TaxID=2806100 RepID=A0ABS1YQX3_9ACTN|nr:hypothetical protein [Micromonospora tarensis]MBM0279672.1 hypothetical protein [Micromonospora tarensis]
MKPFVGLPVAEAATCAYSADLDQPACGQPTTVHVLGWAEGWGWVVLNTCAGHLDIAKAGCAVIGGEHPAAGCSGEHHVPESQ